MCAPLPLATPTKSAASKQASWAFDVHPGSQKPNYKAVLASVSTSVVPVTFMEVTGSTLVGLNFSIKDLTDAHATDLTDAHMQQREKQVVAKQTLFLVCHISLEPAQKR
jgi:hypothetical protein